MFARRALVHLGLVALSLTLLGATPMRFLPGYAQAYSRRDAARSVDTARLDAIASLAAEVEVTGATWGEIARRLTDQAEARLGRLDAMDRYWLGSAWWAVHQPVRHLNRPAWAVRTPLDPDSVLAHPEGGNCESSANGHAALLTALGVPSMPVYGYHHGAREPHVWTVSDVEGHPMLADVHLARNPWGPWRPRAEDVMAEPSRDAARAFLRLRTPDNLAQSGLTPLR